MGNPKKIGLFFGSFNPIHNGHLMIANWIVEFGGVDQVWFVVSPLNPFKKGQSLLADYHRIELANRAVADDPRFRVSTIETKLPQPSYTIDTLTYLADQFPEYLFSLIMGEDQLPNFNRWKNHEQILAHYKILVYPRPNVYDRITAVGENSPGHKLLKHPTVKKVAAPMMEISSTFIRQAIRDGKDVRFFLPQSVWEYIDEMNFYR